MAYTYDTKFRTTEKQGNADVLSRLPAGPDKTFDEFEESCFPLDENDVSTYPVDYKKIQKEMKKDITLQKVKFNAKFKWPDKLPENESNLKTYFLKRRAISIQKELLLVQTEHNKVIIPKCFRPYILNTLHEGH